MSAGYGYAAIAGLQLAGGYFAAQNIRETAELNREIAEMNAQFAEWDAYDSELEGLSELARYQSTIDKVLSEQRAIAAAQGVDLSFGTAGAIHEEDKFNAELNKMELQKRAQESALGYTRQARDIRLGATLEHADAQRRAGQTMFNSAIGAAQTGISGYKKL